MKRRVVLYNPHTDFNTMPLALVATAVPMGSWVTPDGHRAPGDGGPRA